jgi:hypothetical protein
VDVESQEDSYRQDVWDAFSAFLLSAGGAVPVSLPSVPHAAAQELQRRQLPFFQGLSLGELEHIVRLAIGKRRLLCHLGDSLRAGRATKPGLLKPEVSKKDAAKVKVDGVNRGDIRDMEDLTMVLLNVMTRFPEGTPLSLLKQHIQTYAHRTLSEADFKCNKLADIFRMAPLRNIFPLEHVVHRNEIMVSPPRTEWIPPRLVDRYRQQLQQHGLGDAAAGGGGAHAGAELGPAGMPYTVQWGAMGGMPMQTQPGFMLGAGTGMPHGWGMAPPVEMSAADGAAGYHAGAWPRPW